MESYEQALGWLAENHCPVAPELDAFETAIRAYPDSEKGILFLVHIEQMRRDLKKFD